jgi:hypothetical protein
MVVYKIRHKTSGDIFVGRNGQTIFNQPSHAKAAFNYVTKHSHANWVKLSCRFDDQDTWQLITFDLVERKSDGEKLQGN